MKRIRRKIWSLLAALFLLPSLIAPALSAAQPLAPVAPMAIAEAQVAVAELRARFTDYDLTSSQPIPVIVELANEPLAIVEESMREQGAPMSDAQSATYGQTITAQQTQVLNAIRSAGLTAAVGHRYWRTFNGMAMQIPANQVEKLLSIPGIIDVFPDIELRAAGLEHSLPAIRAPQAWALPPGLSGRGILVAVLDTGADYMHPDLGGGIGPGFKVIGGTDFIDDDNDPMERKNDPGINPATGSSWNTSHGTHVAATVAAVAPEASIYKIRVLGRGGSGSSSDVMAGIERTVQIGAHVANMSLGGALGHPDSPWARAVDNAVRAGVVFTVSAGNSGPGERTTGTYANTRLGIAVGWADTTPKPLILPQGATAPMVGSLMTFSPALAPLGTQVEFVSVGLGNLPADFRDAAGNSLVTGRIALMERGGAAFGIKSRNARDAGAIGAIIFNNAAGAFSGTLGAVEPGDIPTLALSQAEGHALRAMTAGTRFVTFAMGNFDLMSPSSSRGPDALLGILPHLSAPGQNITAAYPFPGTDGSHVSGAFQRVPGAGNPWFGTISGTSMAAPHVAGAVALMLQANPSLTPEQIRLMLMNTATDIREVDGRSFRPIDQGAGMINVFRAITAGLRIDPGILNFREVVVGETQSSLALQSLRTSSAVFRTRVEKRNPAHAYEVLVPGQVTVGAGARVNVPVALFVDASLPQSVPGASDYTGYIIFENTTDPADSYRVPFFFVNGQVVSQVQATPDAFSPNGDGVQDTTTISFVLGRAAHATRIMVSGFVQISPVGTFHVAVATFGPLQPGRYSFVWNGATPAGFTSPDRFGQVHVQVQPTAGAAWTPAALSTTGPPPTIAPGFARLQIDSTPPAFHEVTPVIETATPNRVRIRGAVDDFLISNLMSDGGSVWVNDQLVPITSQNMPVAPFWDWAAFESQLITATLHDNNTATLRARDSAGNQSTQNLTFTGLVVDNAAATNVPSATATVRVQGTVVPGMTLTINGNPATYTALGRFDVTLPLVFGANSFTVTATVPQWAGFEPISRTFTVHRAIPVTGVTVTQATATVAVGQTQQLAAAIAPSDATNQTITWSSSNVAVASVSETGLVTAHAVGTANVTATTADGNFTGISVITAVIPATGIALTPASATLAVGTTQQLNAVIDPTNATNQSITWTSSAPAVATVSSTGEVTALTVGGATITATTADGDFTASSAITVVVPVTGVTLTPTTATINVGAQRQLTATVAPVNATNKAVTWTSSNTAVATVSPTGMVQGVSAGVVTITVTTADGARTATSTIIVGIPIAGITVTPETATVNLGATRQLTATVTPLDATNQVVTWSSSNTAVATVNASGLVATHAAGTATITARTADGGHTDTAVITVVVPATRVTLSVDTVIIQVGTTKQFTATVLPTNATNKAVTWTSSHPAVASVSETGLLTALTAGTTTITVTTADGGHTATSAVTVAPVPVTGITVAPATADVVVGRTTLLTATLTPANATNKLVHWTSSNSAIATVNHGGLVTGIIPGTVTITARTDDGNIEATSIINVVTIGVTGVTVAPTTARVVVGGTVQLTPTVAPTDATNKEVTWASSHPAVATVSATGLVTAVGAGEATITVTTVANAQTATSVITVFVPVASVAVTPETASINVGATQQLTALVLPNDATDKSVVWVSGNTAIATVSPAGLVTGVSGGTVTITATTVDGLKTAQSTITVTVPVTGVTVVPLTAQIAVRGTLQLTATVAPANATNKAVFWLSSNEEVATVSATGLVTAVSAGTANIVVTTVDGLLADTSVITVVTVPVTGVTVTPPTANLAVGATLALTHTITPADATNTAVSWTSSNTAVATVNVAGEVTAHAVGTTVITVTTTDGLSTATSVVTVLVPVTSVSVLPDTATVNVGDTLQLAATVSPAEAIQAVTWSTSNATVATVDANGLVTTHAAGEAIITATAVSGGLTATSTLTVIPVPVTGVSVVPPTAEIVVGATRQLTATVAPVNATNKAVSWTSSNTAVATVHATSGLVTAVSAGTATITVTTADGPFTATSVITVVAIPVTSVTVTPATASLAVGATLPLTHTITPADATNKAVSWTSSNTAVATVNAEGVVTALTPGTATITATSADGPFGTSVVTVFIPVASVSVDPTAATLNVGATRQLTATVLPADATTKSVTWASSNMAVATVDVDGLVTAIGAGTATITVTTVEGAKLATSTITVVVPVAGVTLAEVPPTLNRGATLQLVATVAPADATNKAVTWASGNTAVATVDANGLVTAVGAGEVTITVRTVDGNMSATRSITVVVPVTGVTVAPATARIAVGLTQQLTATVAPNDATNKAVTWSSTNEAVATVAANGLVTAHAVGTATIRATTTQGAYIASSTITVYIPVTSVTVAPTVAILGVGDTRQLVATVLPLDATDNTVTWSSSATAVATVSTAGLVTAVGEGTAIITVTTADGGRTATSTIIVLVPVTGVTLAPATVGLGQTRHLAATVLPANATNKAVTWASDNTAIASVNAEGVVTGVALGTANITVTTAEGGFTATGTVTVIVPVASVSIAPTTATLNRGATKQLTATVLPADATTKSVTWASSNTAVATVDVDGLVTAIGAGTATITVTTVEGAKLATSTITVVVPVTGVTLAATPPTLNRGATLQLVATVAPADATDKRVTWASSNTAVATVDANGLVSAVGAGEVTITVTTSDGNKSATRSFTVVVPVASVAVAPETPTLRVGGTVQLDATVLPADATNKSVTWSSSDVSVATVSATGEVRAIALGTATITATAADGVTKGTALVTVGATPVASVAVTPEAHTLRAGGTIQLNATVLPADATNKSVTWSSSDEDVATVSDTGMVTVHKVGEAVITVTTEDGGKTATSTITVEATPVASVALAPATHTLRAGGTIALAATVLPVDATNKSVTWSSSDQAVATVSATGMVTAGSKVGEAVITVTTVDGGKTATSTITVLRTDVTGVNLTPVMPQLQVGGTLPMIATVLPATATNPAVTWSSSNIAVATVSATGVVTARNMGTTVITVRTVEGNFTATTTVTVGATTVTGVTVSPTERTLPVGQTVQLTATVQPASATNRAVAWLSDAQSVARVDDNGLVTAVAPGTATITVITADGGRTATATITVVIPVASVSVSPVTHTLRVSGTIQLNATVLPVDATNKSVAWSSNDAAVATVSDTGMVTAHKVGEAIITVTTVDGGRTATSTITVEVTPVASVALAPSAHTLRAGGTIQLNATVLPVDATNKSVTWSSSDQAVATVNATGMVTAGSKLGEAVITATTVDGDKTATSTITVEATPVTGVVVTPTAPLLRVGNTVQLNAQVSPEGATNKSVTWSSSNTAVATVSATGLVTARAVGQVIIIATTQDGGFVGTMPITVEATPVASVALTPTSLTLRVGLSATLLATITPADATNLAVAWESSHTEIATVDNGVVTAVAPGTATITVITADGGRTATATIDVVEITAVTGISIDQPGTSLHIGQTVQFRASVLPANATNPAVSWSSDKPDVAAVDQNGLVTARAIGAATITATALDGGFTATARVMVEPIRVSGVELNQVEATMVVGTPLQLTATVRPENAANRAVTWSSSDPSVATVDENGLVTALAVGQVTITVTTAEGNHTATSVIQVMPIPVTGVTLAPSTFTLGVGTSREITATVNPINASNRNVTWTSSDEAVATVRVIDGRAAVVTARAIGTAVITVTTEDGSRKATSTVTVEAIRVTGVVVVNEGDDRLGVGKTAQLRAVVLPENATNQAVTWSTNDASIATVDASGLVTTHSVGTATITATSVDGNKSGSTEIVVVSDAITVTGVSLAPEATTLAVGATRQLVARIAPADATNKSVTWSSSDAAVATVSDTGMVTAHKVGEAVITVTTVDGERTATSTITVAATSVTSVAVTPLLPQVPVGGTVQMIATVAPATATNPAVTWSSSNIAVASVSASGLVTAHAIGTATITVTTVDGGRTATTEVTVTPPVAVTGITLTPMTHTLATNATVQLVANILPANATNRAVTWLSTNPAVASVDATGLVTGRSPGIVRIMATTVDGRRTAVATITVVQAALVPVTGVLLTPSTVSLTTGGTEQLQAIVAPTNATNRNVTWSSSHPAIASVSPAGLVTAHAAGTATISVTTADGAHVATSVVTVVQPVQAIVPVTGIVLEHPTTAITVGGSSQFTARVQPAGATNQIVTWQSSNLAVASVSSTGLVTAHTPGQAVISVVTQDGSFRSEVTVTVTAPTVVVPVTGITVSPLTHTIIVGGTVTVVPIILPLDATNRAVTWVSTNQSVATVDANGVVNARAPGIVRIFVTTVDGRRTAVITITVIAAPQP